MKEFSEKVLKLDNQNTKAVYRLAFALNQLTEYEKALIVIDKALPINTEEL